MAFGRGNLRAGDHQKTVHSRTVVADQSAIPQVAAAVASVMVGQREPMKALFAGSGDQRLRTANSIPGEEGVHMRINAERHTEHCGRVPIGGKVPRCYRCQSSLH